MEWTARHIAGAIGRPVGLRAVLLAGADGGFGDESGSSRGMSSPQDLLWLLTNRALADVLVVSYGTAKRERYPAVWTARGEFAQLREELGLPLAVPVLAVSGDPERQQSLRSSGFIVSDFDDLRGWLLAEPGRAVVCEGGPALVERLMREQLVAELAWAVSPIPAASADKHEAIDHWREGASQVWRGSAGGFEFSLLKALAKS